MSDVKKFLVNQLLDVFDTDQLSAYKLNSSQRLILIKIAKHAKREKPNSCPSIQSIAKFAGISLRCVQKNIRDLEKKGLLKVKFQATINTGFDTNSYHPNLKKLHLKPIKESIDSTVKSTEDSTVKSTVQLDSFNSTVIKTDE